MSQNKGGVPSPHHNFIWYKRLNINEEFLFVAFHVDGPGTAFSLFTVRMLCANTLPMNALGSPFQATVKPAGDHLCAICWNGIYILGLDYLVVSFCIESTLWVVSNKPCLYNECQPWLSPSKLVMTAQLAVYKKKPASLTLIQGMQRRGWTPTEGVAKGPFWAILRAVKLRFLSSLGIRAIVNNYHLGLTN